MKTVCLLPVATDARIQRRLAALESQGITTKVLAFERDSYPGLPPTTGFQSLGTIDHGHYASRLTALLGAWRVVRAAVADADVVYAFSLDLHALAWLVTRSLGRRRPALVYEVADIHPTLVGTRLTAQLMRAIERRVLSDTQLIVVTSNAFITGFYRDVQRISPPSHVLIENKPNLESIIGVAHSSDRHGGPITIGYFGMIRCRRSWQTLRQIAARGQGRIRVSVRGVPLGLPDFDREAAASPWIDYGGPYLAPDELPQMYGRVDLCWSAHRLDCNNSLLWNRLNRFYEACALLTPMIAQAGTQDGEVVAERRLGLCIDLANVDASATAVLDVTWNQIEKWKQSINQVPRSVYTENGEHQELARRILRLANAV